MEVYLSKVISTTIGHSGLTIAFQIEKRGYIALTLVTAPSFTSYVKNTPDGYAYFSAPGAPFVNTTTEQQYCGFYVDIQPR